MITLREVETRIERGDAPEAIREFLWVLREKVEE